MNTPTKTKQRTGTSNAPTATSRPKRRGPGRPPSETQAQHREHLLRCALDAFLANGYEGASINAIAAASGISRDTFYRQYGNKEELFRAATLYALQRLTQHLQMAVAAKGTIEQVLIRAAMQVNVDMTSPEAVAVLRLILAEAPRFPDVARRMFEDSRVSLAPLSDYLEAQRQAGEVDFADAFEAAFMLSTLAFGGVSIFFEPSDQYRSRPEKERWVKQVVKTMLRGWTRAPKVSEPAPASGRRKQRGGRVVED